MLRDSGCISALDGLSVSVEWDQDAEPWTTFEVCPKVGLLDGASEFCGKKVADILLFNQKSQSTSAFCVPQTSILLPEEGARGISNL